MKFNLPFSVKTFVLIILGLFYLFIIVQSLLGNIEGMTDSDKIKKINSILNDNSSSGSDSNGSGSTSGTSSNESSSISNSSNGSNSNSNNN
jgi:hypothetical protein